LAEEENGNNSLIEESNGEELQFSAQQRENLQQWIKETQPPKCETLLLVYYQARHDRGPNVHVLSPFESLN
jgi:hypothetical protein